MVEEKKSWIVLKKCVVLREYITEDCTYEQVKNGEYWAIDVNDVETEDSEVIKIEPNE